MDRKKGNDASKLSEGLAGEVFTNGGGAGGQGKSIVLVDMDYLGLEFRRNRQFFAQYHNNNDLPQRINEATLTNFLCRQFQLDPMTSDFYAFHVTSRIADLFDARRYSQFKLIRCKGLPCFEMEDLVNSLSELQKVVLVADQLQYVPNVIDLVKRGYVVEIIKHRQLTGYDKSVMPTGPRFQYADIMIAACLGVRP